MKGPTMSLPGVLMLGRSGQREHIIMKQHRRDGGKMNEDKGVYRGVTLQRKPRDRAASTRAHAVKIQRRGFCDER